MFGIIGSILGAAAAGKGTSGAMDIFDEYGHLITDEIKRGEKKGLKAYRTQYDKAIAQFEPYRQLGTNLLDRYEQTLTPGSKWYQWRQREGEKSVNRYLASRGLYGSGEAATEAFQRMNTQLSAEEERDVYNRLLGGLELGYRGTGASTALRTQKVGQTAPLFTWRAGQLGNLYTWLAENKARLTQEKGNQKAGLYSGLGNTLDQGLISTYGMGAFG